MAKTPIRPSWADAVRIIIGGGEYAEQRLPDLFASLIAAGQDDNVLMATISHWLRTVDTENEAALGYGVARWLKGRGPAAAMLAHALETTLRTAHELNEYPAGTLAAATPEDRERFRMALVAKFQNNVERARARFATTFNNLGGGMADPNTPTEPKASAWTRFVEATGFSKMFDALGNMGTGAGKVLENMGDAAADIMRVLFAILGGSILYCGAVFGIALFLPEVMSYVAWASFGVLVGVPALMMIFGAARREGLIAQGVAAFMLWFVCSTLLYITFALAGAAGMYTGENIWRILVAGPVIFVIWDRVMMGITQSAVRTGKFNWMEVKAFFSGGKVDETERKEIDEAMRKAIYLIRISITATAAVLLIWFMMVIVEMNLHPLPFHLSVLLVTGLAFLSIAYARMALALWREGDWPKHLDTLSKGWAATFFQSAQRGWVVAGAVGLGLLVFWGIFNDPKTTDQTAVGSQGQAEEPGILQRIGDIGKASADMALDEAEDAVGINRAETKKSTRTTSKEEEDEQDEEPARKTRTDMVRCGDAEIPAEKVRKDRKTLGSEFCSESMGDIYPCNCE